MSISRLVQSATPETVEGAFCPAEPFGRPIIGRLARLGLVLATMANLLSCSGGDGNSEIFSVSRPLREDVKVETALHCPSCRIVYRAERKLPVTGRKLIEVKAIDPTTDQIRGIALDEHGIPVDPKSLDRLETSEARRVRGALSPRLLAWAEAASDTEERRVNLTLLPELEYPSQEVLLDNATVRADWAAEVLRKELAAQATLTGCVRDVNGTILQSDARVNILARLTASSLLALRFRCGASQIDDAEQPPTKVSSYLDGIKNRADYDPYWTSNGHGITVAVLEEGSPTAGDMAALPGIPADGIQFPGQARNFHILEVASTIRTATFVQEQGGNAPGATTILGNAFDSSIPWALSKSARVMNRSFYTGGGELSMGNLDYYSRQPPFPLIVSGAGNYPDSPITVNNWNLNGLIVGGANPVPGTDQSVRFNWTLPLGSFMNRPSPHSDRELPDIAAAFTVTGLWPQSGSGTSFSTPQVSAAAARLLSANSALLGRPYALRAILQATADQDVDGILYTYQGPDQHDGTGLLNVARAMKTAQTQIEPSSPTAQFLANGNAWGHGEITEDSTNHRYSFQLPWNKAYIRVAIAFQGTPPGGVNSGDASILDADLDIAIRRADGNYINCLLSGDGERDFSVSFDASFEFFECHITNPDPDNKYNVFVNAFSMNRQSASYGIAIAAAEYWLGTPP
jgi:hypothetical protein